MNAQSRKPLAAVIDAFLAGGLWAFAVWIRIALGLDNAPEMYPYLKYGLLIGPLTAFAFSRVGLYRALHFRSPADELVKVVRANGTAFLSFIFIGYFFSEIRISRATLIIYAIISTAFFILERFGLRAYVRWQRANQKNQRDFILVGNGEPLKDYIDIVRRHVHLGIRLAGWIDAPEWATAYGIPNLGGGDVEELNLSSTPSAFVVSYDSDHSDKIDRFLRRATNEITRIFVLPDLKSFAFLGLRIEDFSGLPIMALNEVSWSPTDMIAKRTIDFLGAGFGLLILSPFLAAIAILVKMSSPGPVFFVQERMGLDGKTFRMLKFRTMRVGPAGPAWTVENDPRRTKFGSFLRATSLDELPQLWNVFIGDMSLVGPRPEQPFYVENFRKEIPAYMLRHKMKAGITGWAQINGWRGDTSLHKRIECDLYYIKNWSVVLDIKILFLTFWKGFVNKNAY